MNNRRRLSCCVDGCLNSSREKPELPFFQIPSDLQRRTAWLTLINREELADKPVNSYRICAAHFAEGALIPGLYRTSLIKNALPSKNLPELGPARTAEKFSQTDEIMTHGSIPADCDHFLNKEVKTQISSKFNITKNSSQENYEGFCLNLYYTSPRAYRLMQSAMDLPAPKTLIKNQRSITTNNDTVLSILKTKVEKMTMQERVCSVVIDVKMLKVNLFYNIRKDRIVGFQEIDDIQSARPATNALVVMVRGILNNWKIPVGYLLLPETINNDDVTNWINKLLEDLLEIGFDVRTLVSNLDPKIQQYMSINIEQSYFFVKKRKIYRIFDVSHLFKLVRNDLISYNIQFRGQVARYDHIIQFYAIDSQKSFKLAPKLTKAHIRPTTPEHNKLHYATQVLSDSVASGIWNYVDLNIIDESGKGTAEFIKLMNNVFDILYSSDLKDDHEYRKPFTGTYRQVAFLSEMLTLFQTLKVINPQNGKDVTPKTDFAKGFQITISAVLQLFDDLNRDEYPLLLTKNLTLDVLDGFLNQMKTINGKAKPTARQFVFAFKKLFLKNITKLLKDRTVGFEKYFSSNNTEVLNTKQEFSGEFSDSNIRIASSEYNRLQMPKKEPIFFISAYLLKKCIENHRKCEMLKSYVTPDNLWDKNRYVKYKKYMKSNLESPIVVPCDDFVRYVKKIENKLKSYFQRMYFNSRILASILSEFEDIEVFAPCPCFPNVYLKKLFIRMRIFHILKYNNTKFRSSSTWPKHFLLCDI